MPPEIKPKHLILMGAIGLGAYLIYKRVTAPPVAPPVGPPVAPPAALRVTDISVSPSEVVVGESTEITVTVENPTDAAGSASVSITVDGREIERLDTGTVDPGAIITLSFTWTPRREDTFEVCAEVV